MAAILVSESSDASGLSSDGSIAACPHEAVNSQPQSSNPVMRMRFSLHSFPDEKQHIVPGASKPAQSRAGIRRGCVSPPSVREWSANRQRIVSASSANSLSLSRTRMARRPVPGTTMESRDGRNGDRPGLVLGHEHRFGHMADDRQNAR
jgi:hypothetical protein